MNSDELLEEFRRQCFDEAQPPLWKDEEIYGYIDDAQKMFCRLTGGIPDASSALTSVTATAGQEFVSISPLILKIRSVRRTGDQRFLDLLNFEDLEAGRGPMTDDYGYIAPRYRLTNDQGLLKALVTGMSANKLRCIDIPATNTDLRLIVYRLPLVKITDDGDQELEIDEQHHIHLLKWMMHRGYSKQDPETFDKGRADQFEVAFRQYCDMARRERERLEHKYRLMGYGGL